MTRSSILGYMQQILPSSVAFQYATGLMASRNSHEHAPAASEVHFELKGDLCTRAAIAAAGHDWLVLRVVEQVQAGASKAGT